MILDLHIHQNRHSSDSILDILTAIKEAKALNIDGICITDHDNLGLRPFAEDLSQKEGLLVIVGVEIYTLDGDILCYGIDSLPKERLSAQATIEYVHERGGVCIAAHPFRNNRRGLEDKLYDLDNIDAIEAYNGRTLDVNNDKALQIADRLGRPMVGGSDAHTEGELGNFCTYFKDDIRSEADFIEAIKNGSYKPISLKEKHISEEIA